MKQQEYFDELIKSKKSGEFTDRLEIGCIGAISKYMERFVFKKVEWITDDHIFLIEKNALNSCKKHALKFDPEKSENAFSYIVQIIRCSFARTYKELAKENKCKNENL